MPDGRPMSEFDPTKPALAYDQLNDKTFNWEPERFLQHFRQYAKLDFDSDNGQVEWDERSFDGWREPG
jgi:hypothetical protein